MCVCGGEVVCACMWGGGGVCVYVGGEVVCACMWGGRWCVRVCGGGGGVCVYVGGEVVCVWGGGGAVALYTEWTN